MGDGIQQQSLGGRSFAMGLPLKPGFWSAVFPKNVKFGPKKEKLEHKKGNLGLKKETSGVSTGYKTLPDPIHP